MAPSWGDGTARSNCKVSGLAKFRQWARPKPPLNGVGPSATRETATPPREQIPPSMDKPCILVDPSESRGESRSSRSSA
ncbi:UNVERIFIED_CONTAM: hypothetical protein Sradi_1307300 [Sesamum radiatum]|uniref:Uncharacterized protein n=1 Tax=Sesamum radiatum TaxID=300843 RepID=A0AAW2UQV5_SESRA